MNILSTLFGGSENYPEVRHSPLGEIEVPILWNTIGTIDRSTCEAGDVISNVYGVRPAAPQIARRAIVASALEAQAFVPADSAETRAVDSPDNQLSPYTVGNQANHNSNPDDKAGNTLDIEAIRRNIQNIENARASENTLLHNGSEGIHNA